MYWCGVFMQSHTISDVCRIVWACGCSTLQVGVGCLCLMKLWSVFLYFVFSSDRATSYPLDVDILKSWLMQCRYAVFLICVRLTRLKCFYKHFIILVFCVFTAWSLLPAVLYSLFVFVVSSAQFLYCVLFSLVYVRAD